MDVIEARRKILLKVKHLNTKEGNSIDFKTDIKAPLESCIVEFSPIQEGVGTPSLENDRPIKGWDGITLHYNGAVLDIQFPKTIFGGYVNLITGEIEETWKEYVYPNSPNIFQDLGDGYYHVAFSNVSGKGGGSAKNSMCSKLSYGYSVASHKVGYTLDYVLNNKSNRFHTVIYSDSPITSNTARQWFIDNNVQLVRVTYTSNSYYFEPSIVNTLKGHNNIYSDANCNIKIGYYSH